ncbi:MAG: hypothetical protein AAGF11_47360 [Myxococcota bacterium]
MLLLPLVTLLLAGPTASPNCEPTDEPALHLGPALAPITVEAFLDPASSLSWGTVLELRRLVSDQGGELRIDLFLAGRGGPRHPHSARVRAFVTSLAAQGHGQAALRVVARDGVERMHVRLMDPGSHESLAQELGVPTTMITKALRDRCARLRVDARTERLFSLFDLKGGAVARLPAFVVGGQAFDDNPTLDRLRPELGRLGRRVRSHEDPRRAPPPAPTETTSERMRRPPLPGVLLGGPGLRHRLVLMARDEDDPGLSIMLAPVLRTRRAHPAQLAVHVVSRGVSTGAETLRHRLCAARTQGLTAAYLDYLARDSLRRHAAHPTQDRLLDTLDQVPAGECTGEVDPVDLDLPDGAWLDGLPRSRQEIETLDTTLRMLDVARRPLDWVFVSPAGES